MDRSDFKLCEKNVIEESFLSPANQIKLIRNLGKCFGKGQDVT